jgi:tetratricopeptide (TPR) repeat protein
MRGDSATSAFLYKQILKITPDEIHVMKRYSVELIRLGDLKEAEVVLAKMYQSSNKPEENVGLILGGVYTALEKGDEAKKVYEHLHKIYPKSEETCVFLAKIYAAETDKKRAHDLLEKCEKNIPNRGIFSYYRGKLLVEAGDTKGAEVLFKKSLTKDKSYHQSIMALGLIKEEKKDYEGAMKIYRDFLKSYPENYTVLSRYVQLMFAFNKQKEAIPYVETMISLDPNDLNLKARLGILYSDEKRFDEAKGIFREILTAVPDSDKILYYLASLHLQTQEINEALDYFSRIPENSTLFLESSFQIAQILQVMAYSEYLQGNEGEKAAQYKKFIKDIVGKYPVVAVELSSNIAFYYENTGNLKEAISSLGAWRGKEGFTENHDYYLASLHEKAKDFNSSREIIESLIEKNPENAHALNFLGYSLVERGIEMEHAYGLIKKAVSLKPEDGYIRDSLGWYYYKTGQYDKALEHIKKAWELTKNDVVITKHLALVYKELKEFEQAKRFYLEALRHCKVESERKEVINALKGLEDVRMPASQSEYSPHGGERLLTQP